jgi:ferritin-like metal-binding protein YciE
MGWFSKDIQNMGDLFVYALSDIYYAEQQIVKALPKMTDNATDAKLKEGFQKHLRETEDHVSRLEQVFRVTELEAKSVDGYAIDGILKEADAAAGEVDDTRVLDAALIFSAQAVEHYEMSRYGALISWAEQFGRSDIVSILEQTLNEEKAADAALTSVAKTVVNQRAAA